MKDKQELKSCPFCGCNRIEIQDHCMDISIGCMNCDFHKYGLNPDELVEAWNTRTPSESEELDAYKAVCANQRDEIYELKNKLAYFSVKLPEKKHSRNITSHEIAEEAGHNQCLDQIKQMNPGVRFEEGEL